MHGVFVCCVCVCVCACACVCVCALHTTIGTQQKPLVAVVSDKRTLHSHADVRYVYYVKEFTLYGMCGCFVCLHAYPMYHVGTCTTWSFTYPFTKRCMRLLGNLPEGFRNPGSSRGPWGFCQADVSGSSLAPEYRITWERQ